jgi:hypothetical protein
LEDFFSSPLTTQQPTVTDNTSFNAFPNATPAPVQPSNLYGNLFPQQTQPNYSNNTPFVPQQTILSTPLSPQQPNLLGSTASISPVAPPSVVNPFAGLDILGSTSKTSFHPTGAAPKTIQQMQWETKP